MRTTPKTSRREPRLFRPPSPYLAIEPQSVDFSYLMTGTEPNDRTEDGIAIVTINGPLEHHASLWGFDSYESILDRVESAMSGEDVVNPYDDDPVPAMPARAVVLRIDSPGGEAAGATYAHRRLRALRQRYNCPLYAYADEMACSAAYELASAADEIWLPDTGTVGSIGVIATLFDRTAQNEKSGVVIELITSGEQKADNHADRELTDDIRDRMRGRVMSLAHTFWRVVAKARNTTPAAIASLQAGVFVGQDAVDVGIADAVAGWNRFLKTIGSSLDNPGTGASARAA